MEKTFLILILLTVAFSCEKDSDEKCLNFNIDHSIDHSIINKWEYLGFYDMDLDKSNCTPTVIITKMNIEFKNANDFEARGACNHFSGEYEIINSDSISFPTTWTTLAGCQSETANEWERIYYKGLQNAIKYEISGNKLEIETSTRMKFIFKIED